MNTPQADCVYGELELDMYGIVWVRVQQNSLHDTNAPRNVNWSVPVFPSVAANDSRY